MASNNQTDEETQAHQDAMILAEASRIRDDASRREAVRLLSKDKRKRSADMLAGKGSLAGKLKARRDAVEAGDLEGAPEAFVNN